MEICQQLEEKLPDLVLGLVEESERQSLEEHLAGCGRCAALYREFARLQRHGWSEEKVPAGLREQTLLRVHTAFARENQPLAGLGLGRLSLAVAGGVGSVLLYLAVLWGRAGLEELSSTRLLGAAAVWMGLMVVALGGALGHYRLRRWNLGQGALFGLLTSGIAVVGVLLCPQETFFALWERSAFSQAIAKVLGPGSSYGLFGLLYALPVALLVSAAVGKASREAGSGWLGAGMAVALWLPAVYLQCSALAVGLLLAWTLGALVGVWGGWWSGIGLRGLVMAR